LIAGELTGVYFYVVFRIQVNPLSRLIKEPARSLLLALPCPIF
jgi:hypothetical protein